MSPSNARAGNMPDNAFSVAQINLYLRRLFDADPNLQDVWIEGEISNLKAHTSGHVYFTLKDEASQIRAVMWKSDAIRMGARLPKNGDQVLAHGKIAVYDRNGEYQLYCDRFRALDMTGDLHGQFQALWAKLEAEGLFRAEIKRPLPPLPRRIGIVTSPTTAALQDVLNILRRRYPLGEVYLSPTPVQGDTAPPQIVEALQRIDAFGVDVILLVRGGGSLEDLWCFNDERIARAIRETRAPVVTGVGHEIDTTLVDGAADRRAPTPSAAAEVSTPNVADLRLRLEAIRGWVAEKIQGRIESEREMLEATRRTLRLLSPAGDVRSLRQRLDESRSRLARSAANVLAQERTALAGRRRALEMANPHNLLARGYAVVMRKGRRLTDPADAPPGTQIVVTLHQGSLLAEVKETLPPERNAAL